MADAHQGKASLQGQPACEGDANQQSPDEARTAGHRQQIDILDASAGTSQSDVHHHGQALQVSACRKLGDDATVVSVELDLRGNYVAEDPPAVNDQRGGGLIARGFYAQNQQEATRLRRRSLRVAVGSGRGMQVRAVSLST